MKLLINASIFSVVFAGFVASAVTIKPTSQFPPPITVWSFHMQCQYRAAILALDAPFRTPCRFPAAIPGPDVHTKGNSGYQRRFR
jgi:hypothetical protein